MNYFGFNLSRIKLLWNRAQLQEGVARRKLGLVYVWHPDKPLLSCLPLSLFAESMYDSVHAGLHIFGWNLPKQQRRYNDIRCSGFSNSIDNDVNSCTKNSPVPLWLASDFYVSYQICTMFLMAYGVSVSSICFMLIYQSMLLLPACVIM